MSETVTRSPAYLEPFEGPALKLLRARYHYQSLVQTVAEYGASAKPVFVKTDRAKDPWQIQISAPVPKVAALQISDMAHNLRSALDTVLTDIALVRDVGISDMNFPFADSHDRWKAKLLEPNKNQPFKKLGSDIVAIIDGAQPFKGGNDLLRGLHDLNNQDKHRMLMPVVSFVSTTGSSAPQIMKMFGLDIVEVGQSLVALDVGAPISDDMFFEHPSEAYKINDTPMIVHFPKGSPIGGDVLVTMERMANAVTKLVETLMRQATGP